VPERRDDGARDTFRAIRAQFRGDGFDLGIESIPLADARSANGARGRATPPLSRLQWAALSGREAGMTLQPDVIDNLVPDLIALRHALHANPELGFQEHETAARLAAELAAVPGLDIRTGVARTGIVATLGAGKPGPCVALRADMDALPIVEETGLPYASQRSGVMHACGHDGHMTCLIGAVRVLAGMADALPGPVRFIFQPAEEGDGGGRVMCEEGALDDPPVAAAFALHGWPPMSVGHVGVRSGPAMASTDEIDITVKGKGAHAAAPHLGADPILAAAHIVTALQSVVSRRLPPQVPAVVTIGCIQGGTARNVIPDTVRLNGTIRTLDPVSRATAAEAVRQVASRTAEAYGAEAEVRIITGYPVLVNDPALAALVEETAVAELGAACVEEAPLSLGGEDFAYYAERVPAVMWRLGVADPAGGPAPGLHNPHFNFADAAIATGVRLHCALVLRYMKQHGSGMSV